MTQATEVDPLAIGPGHNSGADATTLAELLERLPSADALIALLEATHQDALDRVAEIEKKGQKYLVIENDEQDSAATEFLVPVRARWKSSEADRVAAKTAFDDLAGAVQAFFMRRILDPLSAKPGKTDAEFDPVTATELGMGPRILMALTIYKRKKAAKEKADREAAAAAAREAERIAAAKRAEEERVRRAEEDRLAQVARDAAAKLAKEEADRQAAAREAARKAQAEADEAVAAAARKRSQANKAAADAEAAAAAKRAAEQAEIQRLQDQAAAKRAADAQAQADANAAKLQAERDERDRLAREEENKLAADRAKAEEAAAATTADMSRSRGNKGGVSSLRESVNWRDVDRDKLAYIPPCEGGDPEPPAICALLPYLTDAAIEKAIKDWAAANKATVNNGIKNGKQPLHGVTFYIDTKAAGRA